MDEKMMNENKAEKNKKRNNDTRFQNGGKFIWKMKK